MQNHDIKWLIDTDKFKSHDYNMTVENFNKALNILIKNN